MFDSVDDGLSGEMMELFDFINDLNYGKKDVFLELSEKEEKKYPSYTINRYFSFMPDTVFFANEMNLRSGLDNKLKHHFYLFGLRKKKRFTKWLKDEKDSDLEYIKLAYNCSERTAREYKQVLTNSDIDQIRGVYKDLNIKNS
jgi:hypothetical protein